MIPDKAIGVTSMSVEPQPCPDCEGRGINEDGQKCEMCGGTGWIEGEPEADGDVPC